MYLAIVERLSVQGSPKLYHNISDFTYILSARENPGLPVLMSYLVKSKTEVLQMPSHIKVNL